MWHPLLCDKGHIVSETTKNAEGPKKGADHTVKPGQASVETATKATKDSIEETARAAAQVTDRAVDAGKGVSETVSARGRDSMLMSARAPANLRGQAADIGFGRSHHMMSSAAHAMDIYRDAAERSAGRVQALMASAMTLGRGMAGIQHAWFEMADHTMEAAAHRPRDLLRCKTMIELAEVQRDLYLDAINHAFESTSRLLEMAGRTAQDAVRPLRS